MHFVHDFFIYLFTGVCFELFRIIILHLRDFVPKCSDVKSHIPIRGSTTWYVGSISRIR